MRKILLIFSLVVVVAPSLTGCGPSPEEVKKQQQAVEDKKALGGEFKPSSGKKY